MLSGSITTRDNYSSEFKVEKPCDNRKKIGFVELGFRLQVSVK